ncbi:MAG: glycosyltransferase family 2 protein [Deltaproteobacteria bacterium]|nr:MAG: glycosyltransferase family 2 protein [Deltaproteobacteria bacterium]
MSARTLVVIPAYNEAATIEQVAIEAQRHADVCVVDDGSTDATPEILARLDGVHVIRHERNTHIAGAILDGMRYADASGYDHVITMDAGMSHDPAAIPSFLARREADLVIGCREHPENVPWYRRLLSRVATFLLNLMVERRFVPWGGARLRDATSGYRMYSRAAVQLLLGAPLRSRAFDFHLEALCHVYRAGLVIAEIPITYVFSNSSLRWKIVEEAARTCAHLWARPARRSR